MILVLTPDRNSPPKKDYTGAFRPAARALKKRWGDRCVVIEIPVPTVDPVTLTIGGAAKQRGFEEAADACLTALRAYSPDHVVFLCHGWSGGVQLGFRSSKQKGRDRDNFDALCNELWELRNKRAALKSICLLACSAGDEPASSKSSPGTGDNSFADALRDRTTAPVLAHWSVGHAVHNPDLIFFDASSEPLVGGTTIQRGTALYRNARRLLGGDTWMELPTVASYAELHALLSRA